MENGPGVQGMTKKLTNVHPEVRARFSQIAGVVFERYSPAEPIAAPNSIRQSNYQPPHEATSSFSLPRK